MNGPTCTYVFNAPPEWHEFEDAWKHYGYPQRIEFSPALDQHLARVGNGLFGDFLDKLRDGHDVVADPAIGAKALFFVIHLDPTKTYEIEGKDFHVRGVPCAEAERIVRGETQIGNIVRNVNPEDRPVDRKTAAGKLMMHLVTSHLARQAAAADTYGAEKYQEPGSWRNAPVEDVYRYVDAAERHLSDVKAALVEGKADRWLAPDSKLSHLAHLAATVGILIEFAERMGLPLPEEFDRHWERDITLTGEITGTFSAEEGQRMLAEALERDLAKYHEPDGTGTP